MTWLEKQLEEVTPYKWGLKLCEQMRSPGENWLQKRKDKDWTLDPPALCDLIRPHTRADHTVLNTESRRQRDQGVPIFLCTTCTPQVEGSVRICILSKFGADVAGLQITHLVATMQTRIPTWLCISLTCRACSYGIPGPHAHILRRRVGEEAEYFVRIPTSSPEAQADWDPLRSGIRE